MSTLPVVLVHNVHLAVRVAQQHVHDVLPLVGDGLKQPILPVFALIIDVYPRMFDQLSHGSLIAIPNGKSEGSCAVVSGKIDINIWSEKQHLDNVRSVKTGSYESCVTIQTSHVDSDIWSTEQELDYTSVVLLDCNDQWRIACKCLGIIVRN